MRMMRVLYAHSRKDYMGEELRKPKNLTLLPSLVDKAEKRGYGFGFSLSRWIEFLIRCSENMASMDDVPRFASKDDKP